MRHAMLRAGIFFFVLLGLGITNSAKAQDSSATPLNLEQCIRLALKNNYTIHNSYYLKKSSDYDVLKSYKGILPSVNVSVGQGKVENGPSEYLSNEPVDIDNEGNVIYKQRTRKLPSTHRSSSSASLSISQTLFDGGIWWNQIRKSKADNKASEYQYESDRNSIILQVQQAYFDLIKQQKLLEVYELAIQRSQAQLDRAQSMYNLGATARIDVYRAKVNLGNDRINFLNQKNVVSEAKKKLNILLGRDPLTPVSVKTEVNINRSLPSLDEMIQTAMQHQPQLKKDLMDVRARSLSVRMAKGLNFPRISVYLNYDRFHENTIKVFSDYDQNYQLRYGLNVSFNLFNGFSDYADIQKAELGRKMAMEALENYKRTLKSQIHKAYMSYKSTLEMIKINRENLDAAKEELRLAEERYQIGAGTALDVRDAQVKLTRAEETLVSTEYQAQLLLAELDNQMGLTYAKIKDKIENQTK